MFTNLLYTPPLPPSVPTFSSPCLQHIFRILIIENVINWLNSSPVNTSMQGYMWRTLAGDWVNLKSKAERWYSISMCVCDSVYVTILSPIGTGNIPNLRLIDMAWCQPHILRVAWHGQQTAQTSHWFAQATAPTKDLLTWAKAPTKDLLTWAKAPTKDLLAWAKAPT